MNGVDLFWLAPALPLAASLSLALGLARFRRLTAALAVATLVGSSLFSSLGLFAAAQGLRSAVSLPWLTVGGRELTLALWLDPLGALAATLVSVVGLLVFVYATSYMAKDPHVGRFFTVFSLFVGAMLMLVLAADLLTLFIAWELVGLCSYLLIGFWFERPGVPPAATKAFLTTRLADLALLAGVLLLVGEVGSGRIDTMLAAVAGGHLNSGLLFTVTLLLFAGAAGKSAQVPFQGWLPDAMAGPTPVSALLHSATMVAAGIFLVARLYPLFIAAGPALPIMAWVGVTTALLGAAAALVQTDLKRLLAYSTMSQLGLMFVGLGSGSLLAGVLLMVTQALYKALLFLAAGAVDHAVESTAFERMGGLWRRMPYTFGVFTVGAAALAGLPVTLALPPKDPVLAAAWQTNGLLFTTVLLASLLTALYSARAISLAFLGRPTELARRAHEAPGGFLAPMLSLAALVTVGLLINATLLDHPLSRLLAAPTPDVTLATALALVVAATGVALGLWAQHACPARLVWPPLKRMAPLFAAEFGLRWVYRILPRLGVRAADAVSAFDRAVFDPLGGRLARSALGVAQRTSGIDRRIFDASASRASSMTIEAVRVSARFDLRRLDAAFSAFGQVILATSGRLRSLQTGQIQNYLLAIFAWGLGLIALAALAIAIR